jgi:hypothetical protein
METGLVHNNTFTDSGGNPVGWMADADAPGAFQRKVET